MNYNEYGLQIFHVIKYMRFLTWTKTKVCDDNQRWTHDSYEVLIGDVLNVMM